MRVAKITHENYLTNYLQFQRRQAGVNLIYCPEEDKYTYNVYCLELDLLKELLSVEFDFLDEALALINEDFGTWDVKTFDSSSKNCGSCAAKKG
jgi:hypothetical protein